MLFLPDSYHANNTPSSISMDFKNYKVDEAFGFHTRSQNDVIQTSGATHDLKDFILKAIYKRGNDGYVVVMNKSLKEATILAKNETYQNYTLTHIFTKYVIFTKNGVQYTLKLLEDNTDDIVKGKSSSSTNALSVSKEEVLKYATDLDAIWKNISIQEVMKDERITGFEILNVKEKSAFGQLGLQAKDIITKINGEPLNSYSQAFKIYNNIASYDYLEITVTRNGIEKDLSYEIK